MGSRAVAATAASGKSSANNTTTATALALLPAKAKKKKAPPKKGPGNGHRSATLKLHVLPTFLSQAQVENVAPPRARRCLASTSRQTRAQQQQQQLESWLGAAQQAVMVMQLKTTN